MNNKGESAPLLPSNARGDSSSSKYYFLNKNLTEISYNDHAGATEVIENVPVGTTEDEFAPRVLTAAVSKRV
jgi:hypothetical protein